MPDPNYRTLLEVVEAIASHRELRSLLQQLGIVLHRCAASPRSTCSR